MSPWTQDDYVKSEFSLGGITLDDILKDYYQGETAADTATPLGSSLSSFTGERTADLTDLAGYLNGLCDSTPEKTEPSPATSDYSYDFGYGASTGSDTGSYYSQAEPVYTPTTENTDPAPASRVSRMEAEAKGVFAQLSDDDYSRLLAEEEAAARRDAQVEIDPRFNLGGKHRRSSMYYDGQEVDQSSDPGYTQQEQGFANPSHAAQGEQENGYFVEEKTSRFGFFKKKKRSSSPKLEDRKPQSGIAEEDLRYTRRAQAARAREEYASRNYAPAQEEYDPQGYAPAQEEYDPQGYAPAREDYDPQGYAAAREDYDPQGYAPAQEAYDPGEYGDDEPYNGEAVADTPDDMAAAETDEYGYNDEYRQFREENLYDNDSEGDEEELDDKDFPGSFKEFLRFELGSLLLRIRGGAKSGSAPTTGTFEEDEEDLGIEVSAKMASTYYGSFIQSLRLRSRIACVVLALMLWLSVGLPVPGMLKDTRVASTMLLACQLNIMLLALDVLTGAVMNMSRLKFGADALVLISCLITSLDAVLVAKSGVVTRHIPLCLLSSLSLLGLMFSSLLSSRSMRKAIRVPAIARRIYTVTGETQKKPGEVTILKSVRSYKGFVRRCEEAPPDETLFMKLGPFVLLISLLFAFIIAVAKDHSSDLIYILSAILAPSIPFCALLSFALPYFIGSDRIFDSGAAIAGWSGLCDVGTSQNLIVTDRDLFPEGSVELENTRIFASEPAEKIVSYACTMLTAGGFSIASCFAEVMERKGYKMRQIQDFEYLSGGGMMGIIDGETVLCGSTDLMRLMNVRIPHRLVDKCSVLIAVNGMLCGIFNMKYTAQKQVRYALTSLMRSNRHPIFAIRDFNVNPEMLHQTFDVATDGYDFPPYVERFPLSDATPSEESKVAAVVCREGLGPLTHMADTGRSMYLAVRINLMISALGMVLTLLTVFLKLLISGSAGPVFLLILMVLCAVPVITVSMFMRS